MKGNPVSWPQAELCMQPALCLVLLVTRKPGWVGPGACVSLVADQLPRSAGLARIVSVSRTFGECRARDTQVALPHCVVPFPLLVVLCSSKHRLAQQDDPGRLVPGAPSCPCGQSLPWKPNRKIQKQAEHVGLF